MWKELFIQQIILLSEAVILAHWLLIETFKQLFSVGGIIRNRVSIMCEFVEENSHFLSFILDNFLRKPLTAQSPFILLEDKVRFIEKQLNILEQVNPAVVRVRLARHSDRVERHIQIVEMHLAQLVRLQYFLIRGLVIDLTLPELVFHLHEHPDILAQLVLTTQRESIFKSSRQRIKRHNAGSLRVARGLLFFFEVKGSPGVGYNICDPMVESAGRNYPEIFLE